MVLQNAQYLWVKDTNVCEEWHVTPNSNQQNFPLSIWCLGSSQFLFFAVT